MMWFTTCTMLHFFCTLICRGFFCIKSCKLSYCLGIDSPITCANQRNFVVLNFDVLKPFLLKTWFPPVILVWEMNNTHQDLLKDIHVSHINKHFWKLDEENVRMQRVEEVTLGSHKRISTNTGTSIPLNTNSSSEHNNWDYSSLGKVWVVRSQRKSNKAAKGFWRIYYTLLALQAT